MESLGDAARALSDVTVDLAGHDANERAARFREVLGSTVHEAAIHAVAADDAFPEEQLRELAAAVSASAPAGVEDGLAPRVGVFVRLLRHGALRPAWMLAEENSAGQVAPSRASSTHAGPARTGVRLPLVTVLEGGRVYAWLPGFRDPRWRVPDDVYDISEHVRLTVGLDEARIRGGRLELGGYAYLTQLAARADDHVVVVLRTGDATELAIPAERRRRSDLVKGTGEELTRLAWAGWSAAVDLAPVLAAAGTWTVRIRFARDGVERDAPLGIKRGPLSQQALLAVPHDIGRATLRLSAGKRGELTIRVRHLGAAARVLPRGLRAPARALLKGRR
ncbi:MAG: hypothetical protein ACR2LX_03980 [Jatrophihabitans sp.]